MKPFLPLLISLAFPRDRNQLICGGCHYLGASHVTGMVEASVKKSLDTDPTVQKHIGKVDTYRTSTLVLMTSAESSQRYLFHLKSSTGDGNAIVLISPHRNSLAEVVCYLQTRGSAVRHPRMLRRDGRPTAAKKFRFNQKYAPTCFLRRKIVPPARSMGRFLGLKIR